MRVDFIIDGQATPSASGATFTRRDPFTGAVATEAAAASEADVAKVVEAAARAFPAWSETGPSARRALLLKAADLLEARTADFSKPMIEEIGATALGRLQRPFRRQSFARGSRADHRASVTALRRFVLIRSPDRFGIRAGATSKATKTSLCLPMVRPPCMRLCPVPEQPSFLTARKGGPPAQPANMTSRRAPAPCASGALG